MSAASPQFRGQRLTRRLCGDAAHVHCQEAVRDRALAGPGARLNSDAVSLPVFARPRGDALSPSRLDFLGVYAYYLVTHHVVIPSSSLRSHSPSFSCQARFRGSPAFAFVSLTSSDRDSGLSVAVPREKQTHASGYPVEQMSLVEMFAPPRSVASLSTEKSPITFPDPTRDSSCSAGTASHEYSDPACTQAATDDRPGCDRGQGSRRWTGPDRYLPVP